MAVARRRFRRRFSAREELRARSSVRLDSATIIRGSVRRYLGATAFVKQTGKQFPQHCYAGNAT